MTHRPVVIALLLASPLSAQTSVETGGGVARLDHYSGGAFSSFRAQTFQSFGPLRLSASNVTAEHRGLGTFSRTNLDLRTSFTVGPWDFTVGSEGKLARGIELPSARTFGIGAGFRRQFETFEVIGSHARGRAWFEDDHNNWAATQVDIHTRLGMFEVGSTLRNLSLNERVPRNDVFFAGNGSGDTMYRRMGRNIQTAGISAAWQAGRVSFSGQIGGQFAANTKPRAWWEGNLAVRVATSLALTMGTSSVASDQLLRLHGGRFTSFGVRIGVPATTKVKADALAFEVASPSPSTYRLRFAIPGASRTATISGDITGWQPVDLVRLEDGRWEVQLTTKPGTYRINVSFDGGAWAVPPGLAIVPDDFGGLVGLLVLR